jgi:hypothetical protein
MQSEDQENEDQGSEYQESQEHSVQYTDTSETRKREPMRNLRDRKKLHGPKKYSLLSMAKALKWDKIKTTAAVKAELQGLMEKDVFTPVKYSDLNAEERGNILPVSMLITEKRDPETGDVTKVKGRLVANGNKQDTTKFPGTDVSAPTVSTASIYLSLAVAAMKKWRMAVADVKTAFLNASIDGEYCVRIHRQIAEFLVESRMELKDLMGYDGAILARVNKAIYGLRQSARLWYLEVSRTLKELKYVSSIEDPCLFVRRINGKPIGYICMHVDDLLILSESEDEEMMIINGLQKKYGEMVVKRGEMVPYLGMIIKQIEGGYFITQQQYIKDIIGEGPTATTPANSQLFKINDNSPNLNDDQKKRFISENMKLMHLATHTRLDLKLPVTFSATRSKEPTIADEKKVRKIFKYLRETKEFGLIIAPKNNSLVAWADSSFDVHQNCASHSASLFQFGGASIWGTCNKQKLIASSSTEAELIAAEEACYQIQQIRALCEHLGVPQRGPTILMQDNQSTITLAREGQSLKKKHLNRRLQKVKEFQDNGLLNRPSETFKLRVQTFKP